MENNPRGDDPQRDDPQRETRGEVRRSGTNRRRRWPFVVGGLVALGLLVLTVGVVALVVALGSGGTGGTASYSSDFYGEEYVSGDGSDKVAVVPVEGQILPADSSVSGTQPTTTPEGLADALKQAEEDESVRAVVLEINSPGGGSTASDEMHGSILDFKRSSGKPVVVSMGDTAASGGYYIATAADEIVANETTITGSLGVVLPLLNFSEAGKKYGVAQNYVKSGEFKTIGSPWKKLTSEEREILQSVVDQTYAEFVDVIVEGRDLPEDRVREIADGRIYSGRQARDLGLVDSFGDLDDAAKTSRKLANIGEATVVRYVQEPTLGDTLLSRFSPQEPQAEQVLDAAGLNLEAKPYYLYLPGA